LNWIRESPAKPAASTVFDNEEVKKYLEACRGADTGRVFDHLARKDGFPVDATDDQGRNALIRAAQAQIRNNNGEILRLLLADGRIHPMARDTRFGRNALHWAVLSLNAGLAKILCDDLRVDFDAMDNKRKKAVEYAPEAGNGPIGNIARILESAVRKRRQDEALASSPVVRRPAAAMSFVIGAGPSMDLDSDSGRPAARQTSPSLSSDGVSSLARGNKRPAPEPVLDLTPDSDDSGDDTRFEEDDDEPETTLARLASSSKRQRIEIKTAGETKSADESSKEPSIEGSSRLPARTFDWDELIAQFRQLIVVADPVADFKAAKLAPLPDFKEAKPVIEADKDKEAKPDAVVIEEESEEDKNRNRRTLPGGLVGFTNLRSLDIAPKRLASKLFQPFRPFLELPVGTGACRGRFGFRSQHRGHSHFTFWIRGARRGSRPQPPVDILCRYR